MVLDTVKSIFFGSAVRIVASVLFVVVVVAVAAFAAGLIGAPSVESVDNEFGEVNDSHTEIRTNMTVTNPNPIGAGAADVSADYVVSMNGIEFATGGADDITLSSGASTERFVTYMRNDRIPEWWVSHIENDEQTEVEIDATVESGALDRSTGITETRTVETDLVSEFESDETRPVNASSSLVQDPVLYVNATRAEWGDVDSERTELELEFDVYNPKDYPIPLSQLGYEIGMNDVVVGEGESDREHVLAPGEETTIRTTTRIQNGNLDEWWVTHIENDQVSQLRIEFDAQIEVAGQQTNVPLDALTYEKTVETDLWGTKNESAAGGTDGGDDAGDGDGADGDSTGDDGEDSNSSADGSDETTGTEDGESDGETATESKTETETATETEDDDVDLPSLPVGVSV